MANARAGAVRPGVCGAGHAAERYLLTRPFDEPGHTTALAPEPAPPGHAAESDTARDGPVVVVDREVSSVRELEALWAAPPPQGTVEPWRTAACMGDVRFEAEAIRRVIQSHTNEAGVADLQAKLAAICRQVARRRRPGGLGPEVVTPATVRELLGEGEALPSAVRETIARERRRLSESSDAEAAKTNDWIEWLEHLPWTRRSAAPIDLARTRAALDAGHAGLDHAKACVIEYLAVRRRNPHGAVLCFAGAPGVGKTSLAYGIAEALGRGFVKLSCGGLRDETDLRGHNRTWKDAQPGWILREMRRVGSKDPVFVLDELDKLDKLGRAPAAVLLEVLDPAQHARFRDAFVELPFDLSEVLFITTANEKVLAAHRCGLVHVVLPHQNRKQVDEDLGDDLRRAVEVHYVTQVDGLLDLALRRAPAAGEAAAAMPAGRVS